MRCRSVSTVDFWLPLPRIFSSTLLTLKQAREFLVLPNIPVLIIYFPLIFTTVFTGEKVTEAPCESPTFTIAWHPKRYIIAYACDDKEKGSYNQERDRGSVKIYGVSKDS